MQAQSLASPNPHTDLQTFELVQSVYALAIDLPAFAPKNRVDTLEAESRSALGDLADSHAQGRLILGGALAIPARPTDAPQPTRPDAAHPETILDPLRHLPAT